MNHISKLFSFFTSSLSSSSSACHVLSLLWIRPSKGTLSLHGTLIGSSPSPSPSFIQCTHHHLPTLSCSRMEAYDHLLITIARFLSTALRSRELVVWNAYAAVIVSSFFWSSSSRDLLFIFTHSTSPWCLRTRSNPWTSKPLKLNQISAWKQSSS